MLLGLQIFFHAEKRIHPRFWLLYFFAGILFKLMPEICQLFGFSSFVDTGHVKIILFAEGLIYEERLTDTPSTIHCDKLNLWTRVD